MGNFDSSTLDNNRYFHPSLQTLHAELVWAADAHTGSSLHTDCAFCYCTFFSLLFNLLHHILNINTEIIICFHFITSIEEIVVYILRNVKVGVVGRVIGAAEGIWGVAFLFWFVKWEIFDNFIWTFQSYIYFDQFRIIWAYLLNLKCKTGNLVCMIYSQPLAQPQPDTQYPLKKHKKQRKSVSACNVVVKRLQQKNWHYRNHSKEHHQIKIYLPLQWAYLNQPTPKHHH